MPVSHSFLRKQWVDSVKRPGASAAFVHHPGRADKRFNLHLITKKTVMMVCVPGKIRMPHCWEVYDNGR